MERSYGVVWREGTHPPIPGKLELRARGLRLEGLASVCDLPYAGVSSVRVGRTRGDRIDGRPSVVVERRFGPPVAISTVAQPSLIGEIAERLASLQLGGEQNAHVIVVLPIKPASREAVRDLLEEGPPFDPDRVAGLDRHEVFLTQAEVVFRFDSRLGGDALAPLLTEPDVWAAAGAWREHVAGPPRIGEDVYTWSAGAAADGLSYLPTPGPGDSDGGDIF
jgi:hypothetical protein